LIRVGREADTRLNDVTGAKADLDIGVGADEAPGPVGSRIMKIFSATSLWRSTSEHVIMTPMYFRNPDLK
jgi:hypothetical protein